MIRQLEIVSTRTETGLKLRIPHCRTQSQIFHIYRFLCLQATASVTFTVSVSGLVQMKILTFALACRLTFVKDASAVARSCTCHHPPRPSSHFDRSLTDAGSGLQSHPLKKRLLKCSLAQRSSSTQKPEHVQSIAATIVRQAQRHHSTPLQGLLRLLNETNAMAWMDHGPRT